MWNKESTKIGVFMGGMSSEREISIKSGTAVLQALQDNGWNAVKIDVGADLAERIREEKIDVAWNALHGIYGEDGCVQGLLEVLQIPYTGSSVDACAISMDKKSTKKMLHNTGVNLILDRTITHGEQPSADWFPCVLKDPLGGSSIGVWICKTPEDLETAYTQTDTKTFILEQYIAGEEITVAVFEGTAYPVVSIRPKEGFFDLEAKYTKGKTEYIVPSPLPEEVCTEAQRQAVIAYNELKMSGIARADFIVTNDGGVFFLEINASPGMTATSLSPMAAQSIGISFPELVENILHTAKCSRSPFKK